MRKIELDYAKGLAILLMILCHCVIGENIISIWVFSFHMPIFFVISGILASEKYPNGIIRSGLKEYTVKRINQLFIPYFIWGGVLILFYTVLSYASDGNYDTLSSILKLISFQGIDSLWFIPCYFFAEVMFLTLYVKLPKVLRLSLLTIIIAIIGILNIVGFSTVGVFRMILKILVGVVFVYIGYLINQYKITNKVTMNSAIVMLILGAILSNLNGFAAIGSLEFQNVILFFASATLTSIAILAIFANMKLKYVSKSLFLFGSNTIIVLCTNNLLIEIIRILDYQLTGNMLIELGTCGGVIFTLLIILIETIVIYGSKGKVGVLFGRTIK